MISDARGRGAWSGEVSPAQAVTTARYQVVHARATEALGSAEKATSWLAKPNRALAGRVPEALLDDDVGATTVLQILGRIEHGVIG